jgi:SAM-dependent methyltransferase
MHKSAHENGKLFFDLYLRQDRCQVLDIGSYNVNGSLRDFRREGMEYTGVDLEAGPGVDVVMSSADQIPFENDLFDAIVTTSTCEHAAHFWVLLLEMMRVAKPGGYLYINAPSNGAFHQYPFDYWRFYPDAGLAFVDWARKNGCTASLVESGICAQGAEQWSDFVAVLQKAQHPTHRSDFITMSGAGFYNVRLYNCDDVINFSSQTEDQLRLKSLQIEHDETLRRLAVAEAELSSLKQRHLARWLPGILQKKAARSPAGV